MKWLGIFFFAIIILLLLPQALVSIEGVKTAEKLPEIEEKIYDELNKTEEVKVIVILRDFKALCFEEAKEKIKINQDKVLSDLILFGDKLDFRLRHKYSTLNAFAGNITKQGLEKLKINPLVKGIYLDKKVYASLTESIPLINASQVWAKGFSGKSKTVCIVDTGIDYTHPDLGGCLGASCKVLGGYDFVGDDNDPKDDNGHGTHCAGIATANGILKGVAPNASLIAIKVLNAQGSGTFADVAAGIDWCVNNATLYNISVISLSLGDGGEYNNPEIQCAGSGASDGGLSSQAIDNAVAQGIFVSVASGNEAHLNGISYPACAPNAVSVGDVYDANVGGVSWGVPTVCTDSTTYADKIVCHCNRDEILDLLAPGAMINSTVLNGGYDKYGGTSMAAPHVAGAAVILQEANPTLTPYEINDTLRKTGKSIYDSATGLTFPRIDVLAAFNQVYGIKVKVKTYEDSSYTKKEKFFTINDTVYIQANVTDIPGNPITDASVYTGLWIGSILEANITLTHYANGLYRGSFSSTSHAIGVYLINATATSNKGSGWGSNKFHLYYGSGASAYQLDWDEDKNNDYILENKHLTSVYDGKQYTNRSLLYLYQKDTNVNYTFSSISDPDSIGRGDVTTSQMRNISFYSFSFQEGENLVFTQFKLIIGITKAGPAVKQKQKLFYDGFESGNFIVGGWSLDSPPPDIGTENVYEGIYSAGKKVYSGYGGKYHRMWRTVDTTSCTNITFSYARAVEDAGSGTVTFTAEYSTNGGTTWIVVETVTDTNDIFTYKGWSLPTGAENNPNVVIRFGGIFGGTTSNSNNDWWVDAVNVTGICQVESKIETQFNITREMKSQDVDYLNYKLHNFGQNISDIRDIFPVISGRFDSVNDDIYHLEDGSDGLVTSLTANRWNNYTNSNYTVVYDNFTSSDAINNNVITLVRFNETNGFQSTGLWYETEKEGLRIRYDTTGFAQPDEVNYILAFTKGNWQTIDQWMSNIVDGNFPSPNFMTSPTGKFISITLLGYPVDFGSWDPGTINSPASGNALDQYIIRINPETNVNVDIHQKGNDYSTAEGYTLGIGNMTWVNINDVAMSVPVTKEYRLVQTNVTPSTDIDVYYWIDIPSAHRAGDYNTTITIRVSESSS